MSTYLETPGHTQDRVHGLIVVQHQPIEKVRPARAIVVQHWLQPATDTFDHAPERGRPHAAERPAGPVALRINRDAQENSR